MEIRMFGKSSQSCLTTFLLLQLLKTKYFVYMVDCLLQLIHLIKSDNSTVFKKSHMKVQFVISFGLILMIDVDGASHLVELDTLLVKIFLNNSIIRMV